VDPVLLLLRIGHVGGAMIWFGGAIIGSFFLSPTAAALGAAAQPFMDHLVKRRRMGIMLPVVSTLNVLCGLALYWRDSNGLEAAWIGSPSGLTFTIGGLAGIASLVDGMILVGPSVAEQTVVQTELAATGGQPSERQRERLERADRRMRLAMRLDLPPAPAGRPDDGDRSLRPMTAARWAAITFILPAIGFGLPTPFVLAHLRQTGETAAPALVPIQFLVFGTAAGQPPAPPMVSGPIVALLAAGILLVDRQRFGGASVVPSTAAD
jgi:hypothetical protein